MFAHVIDTIRREMEFSIFALNISNYFDDKRMIFPNCGDIYNSAIYKGFIRMRAKHESIPKATYDLTIYSIPPRSRNLPPMYKPERRIYKPLARTNVSSVAVGPVATGFNCRVRIRARTADSSSEGCTASTGPTGPI